MLGILATMSFANQVIETIKQIPGGKVATYGQIAAVAGSAKAARLVGWILSRSAEGLPWHRVINSKGRISIVNIGYPAELQVALLEKEGIIVERRASSYYIDLAKYLWKFDKYQPTVRLKI